MSRLAAVVAAGLTLGIVAPAAAEDPSPEAACITVLRRTSDRLSMIERKLSDFKQNCSASSETLDRAKRDLDTESRRAAKLDQENAKLKTEADGLSRQNSEQASRLATLQDRLKSVTGKISATAASQIREALSGSHASCERVDVLVDPDGTVRVSGRLLKADDAKRRIAGIADGIAGAVANSDELVKIDVCGQPIGDGWIMETNDGGPRRASYRELSSDAAARLPEGTDDTCKSIGARIDALPQNDPDSRRAFWVIRPGTASSPRPGYCQSVAGEGWRYSDTGVPQVRALVVQRSN